jgi:hypothetical protein
MTATASRRLRLKRCGPCRWTRYYGGRGETIDERLRCARYSLRDRVKLMAWLEGLDL